MKKIIILGFMIILMINLVSAVSSYEPGDTVRIDAFYTEAGIYAQANANITISYPSGLTHISNENMTEIDIGIFYYDYLTSENITGTYKVTVRFYNDSGYMLGSDTGTFDVGVKDQLKLGTCPDSKQGQTNMWIVVIILIVLGFVGMFTKIVALLFISGFILLFMTLIVWGCGAIIGIVTILLGLIYIIIGLNTKN